MPKTILFNEQKHTSCEHYEQDPVSVLEPLPREAKDALFSEMAELLTPILLFLARGNKRGTLEVRNWVFLYSVRPELLGNETLEAFAKRRGVSQSSVSQILAEFRRAVPGYRASVGRGRPVSSPPR